MASYAENVSLWWRHHVINMIVDNKPTKPRSKLVISRNEITRSVIQIKIMITGLKKNERILIMIIMIMVMGSHDDDGVVMVMTMTMMLTVVSSGIIHAYMWSCILWSLIVHCWKLNWHDNDGGGDDDGCDDNNDGGVGVAADANDVDDCDGGCNSIYDDAEFSYLEPVGGVGWQSAVHLVLVVGLGGMDISQVHVVNVTRAVLGGPEEKTQAWINSLFPGRFEWNCIYAIFELIHWLTDEVSLVMPLDFTDGKSKLVQEMAWCRQAPSHYLSQCWHRSLLPYGVNMPNTGASIGIAWQVTIGNAHNFTGQCHVC